MVQNMPAMHRDHQCLSPGSAQLLYIREASSGHTHYGLHLYRLRSSKKDGYGRSMERSAERIDSRSLTGTMDRSAGERTLDRARSKHKSTLEHKGEAPSKSLERDPSEPRTLERPSANASSLSASGSENLGPSDVHGHTGTVWLGICGRGIDIYEVRAAKPTTGTRNCRRKAVVSGSDRLICFIWMKQEEDSVTKTLRATFQWPNIGKLCFEVSSRRRVATKEFDRKPVTCERR